MPQGLGSAIAAVLASDLPDHPAARRSDIDLVLGARRLERNRLGTQSKASYETALIWVLVYSGLAREAAVLADQEVMELLQRVAGTAPSAVQSVCYSVLSQAYILNGRVQEGADCARIAIEYADEAGDDACRYRASGLQALAFALNGQFTEAGARVALAHTLCDEHGWAGSDWVLALAGMLIATRRADAAALEARLAALSQAKSDHILNRIVGSLGRSWIASLREDYQGAIAELQSVSHGAELRTSPPFLVDLAVSLKALALIHLGDYEAALKAIGTRESPPSHSVCFELLRATIHIHLGEPRKALQATESCVRGCPDHNLRSLPSVFLRRAVAHEMLGNTASADMEFSKSSHLAAKLGGIGPALALPLDILETLLLRLVRNEPEFGQAILDRIPLEGQYPDAKPSDVVPVPLTDRERVLAEWLITGMTLPEIAKELHVSINTLKTQTRSLYKKLEVSSRSEAISRLERLPHISPAN